MSTAKAVCVINEALAEKLEEIFREHSRLVYRTAYSVTGSSQDAEDVVQNLFLTLLRRGFPSGLEENPKAYLYRAAVNLSLNAMKSRKRHAVSDNECPDLPGEIAEQNRSQDVQGRLLHAIAQLKPRAVEMLILRYEHGYTDTEIGKLLGCSRGVVAVSLYRARARLKRLLRASS